MVGVEVVEVVEVEVVDTVEVVEVEVDDVLVGSLIVVMDVLNGLGFIVDPPVPDELLCFF